MNKIRFSRYRNINSIVHKIDPITKLLGFILLSVSIFLAKNMSVLLVVLGALCLISLLARVRFYTYFKLLFITIPFFLFLLLIYYLVTLDIKDSLYNSGQVFIRMYMFILSTVVYTSTTQEIEITNSLSTMLYPLKFIKVPTYEISLMLMLAIRLIPLILLDLYKIFLAQSSRGINSINGNIKEKIISFKNALLPLFILSFKRSDDISISMQIRGYKIGQKRTKFFKNKFKFSECITLIVFSGLLVSVVLMNLQIIPGVTF